MGCFSVHNKVMENIEVAYRPARSSDAPFVAHLCYGTNSVRSVEERLRGIITSAPSVAAVYGGNNAWHVVGVVTTRKHDLSNLEIQQLRVAAEYQGQGIGTYLLRQLEQEAAGTYSALSVALPYSSPSQLARDKDFFMRRNGYKQIMNDEGQVVLSKIILPGTKSN